MALCPAAESGEHGRRFCLVGHGFFTLTLRRVTDGFLTVTRYLHLQISLNLTRTSPFTARRWGRQNMDRFSRTLLSAAAESGLATITLSRHVPSFRRSIHCDDEVVILAHCLRPDGQLSGGHLLLLTRRHVIVTKQSRVLNRIKVEVDSGLADLDDVRWSADPNIPGVEVAFNAGGTRQRFWIDAQHGKQVWRLDALLAKVFRRPSVSMATLTPVGRGYF